MSVPTRLLIWYVSSTGRDEREKVNPSVVHRMPDAQGEKKTTRKQGHETGRVTLAGLVVLTGAPVTALHTCHHAAVRLALGTNAQSDEYMRKKSTPEPSPRANSKRPLCVRKRY